MTHHSLQHLNGLFLDLDLQFQLGQVTLQSLDCLIGHIDVLVMMIQPLPVVLVLLEVVLQDSRALLVLLTELDLQVASLKGS